MEMALPLVAVGSKLGTYPYIAWAMVGIGGFLFAVGWLWLVFQNFRYNPLHGVLSVIIPIWAVIYGFLRMEHKAKSPMMTACIGGVVWALLGYALVYAGWVCEADDHCMIQEQDEAEEETSADDSSSVLLPTLLDELTTRS